MLTCDAVNRSDYTLLWRIVLCECVGAGKDGGGSATQEHTVLLSAVDPT